MILDTHVSITSEAYGRNNTPWVDIDVSNAVFSLSGTSQIISAVQTDIQYLIKALGLIQITFLPVGNIFWGSTVEVVGLPLHGADTAVCEEDPLQHLTVMLGLLQRVEPQLVILVIMLGQVEQDSGRFEDAEPVGTGGGFACPVDEDRNTAVGVQGVDEPLFFLFVSFHVDFANTCAIVQ